MAVLYICVGAGSMLRTMHLDARAPVSACSRPQIDSCIKCVATSRASVAPKPAKLSSTRQHLEHSLDQPAARVPPTPAAETSSAAQHSSAHCSQAAARQKGRNIILLDGDCLESTNEHRAIVGAGLALMGGLLAVGAVQVHDAPSAAAAVAAAASGYLVADLLSGVYHWGVDNYGDGSTPVFGSQIAGFQAHHQRPWTITERQFANNVHKVFKPALPFAGACLAASPLLPAWASVFFSTATFFTVMSQQFHAWSHMKGSELPQAVIAAQDAGLLISRKAHGAHHKAPFEGNYCIVSGFWNPILDQDGSEDGFFRRLERVVHTTTGVEPRCWHEPSYEWESMDAQPSTTC